MSFWRSTLPHLEEELDGDCDAVRECEKNSDKSLLTAALGPETIQRSWAALPFASCCQPPPRAL
jgi:hypothetical protein